MWPCKQGANLSSGMSNQKFRQIYETVFFKNGTSGNEWQWWLLRKNKSCRRCYMRVSRRWCRGGGRESGQSLADSHGWRDEAESLERPQCLVSPCKEPDEKAAHRENSADLLKCFLMHVYEENHLRPGKEPSERIRGEQWPALILSQK